MSTLNLKFNISNKDDVSVALGVIITLLSVYLNISTRNTVNIISIPVTCLIVILSSIFGAIQVSVQNVTYNVCDCKNNDIYDETDDETDNEEEDEDDEDEEDDETNNTVAEETNNQCDCNHSQWVCPSCNGAFSPTDSVSNVVEQVSPGRSLEQLREFAETINENNRKKRARWEMDLSGQEKVVLNPEEYLTTPLSVDTGESSS